MLATNASELPYYDGLESFDPDPRCNLCNCGRNLEGQPFYVCVICFAVYCELCGKEHENFKHYSR